MASKGKVQTATLELTAAQVRQTRRSLENTVRWITRKIEEEGDSWRIPLGISERVLDRVVLAEAELEMRNGEVAVGEEPVMRILHLLTGALLTHAPISVSLMSGGPSVLGRVRAIDAPDRNGEIVVDVGGVMVEVRDVKGIGYVNDETQITTLQQRGLL